VIRLIYLIAMIPKSKITAIVKIKEITVQTEIEGPDWQYTPVELMPGRLLH